MVSREKLFIWHFFVHTKVKHCWMCFIKYKWISWKDSKFSFSCFVFGEGGGGNTQTLINSNVIFMIPTIFILKKLLIIFFIRLISWLNMQICKSQDEEIILQRKEGKKKKTYFNCNGLPFSSFYTGGKILKTFRNFWHFS